MTMDKETEKQPKRLLDEEWSSALMGMAKQIQTDRSEDGQWRKLAQTMMQTPAERRRKRVQALTSTDFSERMEQARKLADSPLGKNWMKLAMSIMAADEGARRLSEIIHSVSDMKEIQVAIDAEPIDAYTLLALVTIERDKEAGELEKRIAEQMSEQGRRLALMQHASTPHARLKPEVIKFYENHAGEMKADGRPRFKTKASFVREVAKKHEDIVADQDTISKWIAESAFKVPHWRIRAAPKKT